MSRSLPSRELTAHGLETDSSVSAALTTPITVEVDSILAYFGLSSSHRASTFGELGQIIGPAAVVDDDFCGSSHSLSEPAHRVEPGRGVRDPLEPRFEDHVERRLRRATDIAEPARGDDLT
jgi:hypothetical protein